MFKWITDANTYPNDKINLTAYTQHRSMQRRPRGGTTRKRGWWKDGQQDTKKHGYLICDNGGIPVELRDSEAVARLVLLFGWRLTAITDCSSTRVELSHDVFSGIGDILA